MQRRDFLKYNALFMPSLAGGFGVQAFMNSPFLKAMYNDFVDTDKVLVLVYLAGGNDGLNTVIPLDLYDTLANVRPEVIIPENKLLSLTGVDRVALHPSLGGLRDLYNDGHLSIIQNVGYPDQDYSHFRSTDIWMTAADHDEILSSGWMGRYLNQEYPNFPIDYPNDIMPDPLAIQIGYNLSLAFQGPASAMGMVVGDPNWFYSLVDDVEEQAQDTLSGEKLAYIRLITKQSQVYGQVIKKAAGRVTTQNNYPTNNALAEQLRIVAKLIAGGLKTRIYMVSLDGFDTHDAQVINNDHTKGEHANLLQALGDGIKAFVDELRYLGISERVMGMTFSEFGRRVISNSSLGTDHGAAAPLFVFGDGVQSSVWGPNPTLPEKVDVEVNLPMHYDFRSIYTTILEDWFCLGPNDLGSIFTNQFQKIPFVTNSPCISTAIHEQNQVAGRSLVDAYPNPFSQRTTIRFAGNSEESILVQLFNGAGQRISTLAQGKFAAGWYTQDWDASLLPAGTYYVRYQTRYSQQGKWLVKAE